MGSILALKIILQAMEISNAAMINLEFPKDGFDALCSRILVEFKNICLALGDINEDMVIEASNHTIKFQVKRNFRSEQVCLKVYESEKEEKRVECKAIEPMYELNTYNRYLNIFNKASVLLRKVTLSMTQTPPVFIQYRIQNMELFTLCLAPMLNDMTQW